MNPNNPKLTVLENGIIQVEFAESEKPIKVDAISAYALTGAFARASELIQDAEDGLTQVGDHEEIDSGHSIFDSFVQ